MKTKNKLAGELIDAALAAARKIPCPVAVLDVSIEDALAHGFRKKGNAYSSSATGITVSDVFESISRYRKELKVGYVATVESMSIEKVAAASLRIKGLGIRYRLTVREYLGPSSETVVDAWADYSPMKQLQ